MTHLLTFLLAVLLLLPLAPATAEAKTTTTTPQVHVVRPGDTLYEIANRHGLTVNELRRLNGLNSSRLKLGQKLALTRASAPPLPNKETAAPKKSGRQAAQRGADNGETYVVKRGDSLYTIARSHSLTVDELKNFNGLAGNNLKTGQRLALSGTRASAPAAVEQPKRPTADTHVVRKGETLFSIARRSGMAVEDLKRINDLNSSRLKIGQRLALASSELDPSPLLLPGDAGEDEVLEMAYSTSSELEQAAFALLSTPYRFGGNGGKGIDCSAFVQKVFREIDIDLPRSAREQFRIGTEIERDQMQKGDLLFFRTYAKYPSHVGIYLGDGKMIHASSRSRRVVVTSIDYPYYRKSFIGAKRISLLDSDSPGEEGEDLTTLLATVATLPPAVATPALAGGPQAGGGPAQKPEPVNTADGPPPGN